MEKLQEIQKIMANILDVQPEEITEDMAIGDIATWDSMNHMRIISEIESHYGIFFTPDVLMNLEDVSDIVRATEAQIKA